MEQQTPWLNKTLWHKGLSLQVATRECVMRNTLMDWHSVVGPAGGKMVIFEFDHEFSPSSGLLFGQTKAFDVEV